MTDKKKQGLKLDGNRDRVFESDSYPKPFEFNESVADVFDDMLTRSVPLYCEVTKTTVDWGIHYYREGTTIYDIGCSTGTTIEALAREFSKRQIKSKIIGVDNSQPMIDRATKKLSDQPNHEIDLRCSDVMDVEFTNASVVVLNYTLQFIPMEKRKELLSRIHKSLVPGGIVFLSDKVKPLSETFFKTVTSIYEEFKRDHGYSKTEIERKKEALDNVLVPLTWQEQIELIRSAGFCDVEPIVKWNNFLSLVALK